MSGFEIELEKRHVTHDGKPYHVWVASVNTPAYQEVCGRTPGEAIHALEREFDDVWGHDLSGNWDRTEATVEEVLNLAQ